MIEITEKDDPRINLFFNYRDKDLLREGLFITEGNILTQRLIHSSLKTVSILSTEKFKYNYGDTKAPTYIADEKLLKDIAGYNFHRGVLGIGQIPTLLEIKDVVLNKSYLKLAVCPDLTDEENLGSIIRTAAALGLDAVICGEECCSPFSRRAIRVAMGSQFFLPIVISKNVIDDLTFLKESEISIVASILNDNAIDLKNFQTPKKAALLFGREGPGLDQKIIDLSTDFVKISMKNSIDSLNVSTAAGILLYDLFYS